MATSDEQAKSVDSSLWFGSFSLLLTDLENLPLSSHLPSSLAEKINENRPWFLNTLNQFKPPSLTSKEALNSKLVNVGSHKLNIKPHFKELALKLSSTLSLNEIQSYIIIERFMDQNTHLVGGVQEFFPEIVLQYYTERQCLLKCLRQLVILAMNEESSQREAKAIWHQVVKLFSDGLEGKLISILGKLLSSSYPENMDVDFYVLWAEEMVVEDNLILELLFLGYYESLCTCSSSKWKELCMLYKDMTSASSNFVKMGVSAEALRCIFRAKIQMLLILVEALNFESLLQMVHDEISLRDGPSLFSSSNIVEMDSVISSFDTYQSQEVGTLILAWAVFLCLVTTLPGKEDHNELMDIDHVGYVRQAFDAASLNYFLEILRSEIVNDLDGPVAGYRSILRTFISAFIASYEVNIQLEDDTLRLILTILCEIYRGEEFLCVQFWDKDSIVDGPIRCLLRSVEGEFPYQTVELTRFLSAVSEGSWPTECVYKFLEKSVGISSVLDLGSQSVAGETSQIVETLLPLHIPEVEGLVIPSKTRGLILRMIDSRTALVRWEYKQSGLLVLLLRIAQVLEKDGNEEVLVVLDLFSRLVSFNTAVCYSLMNIGKAMHVQANYSNGQMDTNIWIDIVEVLCNFVRNLSPYCGSVVAMSMCVNILSKMMKCSPSHVSMAVMKMNIFDLSLRTSLFNDQSNGLSSSTWLLSGRLAKMLLVDCEHNRGCPFAISVLEFTMQLLESGVENDFVLALVIFCLQYVFVNHEYWKYKVKQDRWKVTLKVLEMLKMCIISIPYLAKIGGTIRDVILSDSSLHSMFFRIICTTTPALEKLYISRLHDWKEIDGLQRAICYVLDILVAILSDYAEDECSGWQVLHQSVLSTSAKPVPVVVALASLMSYFRDPAIQVRATAALSALCLTADLSGSANFGLDSKQVVQLRQCIEKMICEQSETKEDLFIAVVKLLSSAAKHQPAFLASIFAGEDIGAVHSIKIGSLDEQSRNATAHALKGENATRLVDVFVQCVERSDTYIQRNPRVLLSILCFVKALWKGAGQYLDIVETIRQSKIFWKHLSESIMLIHHKKAPSPESLSEAEAQKFAYLYQCQSTVLDIMALEMFLWKKLRHAELLVRQVDEPSKGIVAGGPGTETQVSRKLHLEDILVSWSESNDISSLLKSSASCIWNSDLYNHAKIARGLLAVCIIEKLATGDAGSLTVPFLEKVTALSTKLVSLPAFGELCTQYAHHGYSEGTKIKALVLNDLYYQLQGELEGREIENGLFKELSQVCLSSKYLHVYSKQYDQELIGNKLGHFFDLVRLRHDIGLDIWDFSEWKSSKKIAETMLFHIQNANSMLLLVSSRLRVLRALITIVTLNTGDLIEGQRSTLKAISADGIFSCMDHVCNELCATIGIVVEAPEVPLEVLNFLAAQAELLFCLVKHVDSKIPSSSSLVIFKTCSYGLKRLSESTLSATEVTLAIRSMLMLLLLVLKFNFSSIAISLGTDYQSESIGEVSNLCLGLLPVLCRCVGILDQSTISLATIDTIVKRFLTPSTWLPVIQQHLQLQQLSAMLLDKRSLESQPVILQFLLTLASVREGAEMLVASGFLSSLRALFSDALEGGIENCVTQEKKSSLLSDMEKPQFIWGLGLAVFTAIVRSLGESSLCADVVDNLICFLFSENAHMIAYHLSAPDMRSIDHDKKRARALKRQTSLSAFREVEYTLMLINALIKQRNSWRKGIKEIGSELRERIIHLLAFISRANHRGESSARSSLLCFPVSKEDIDYFKKPSFVNSKSGWFGVAACGCLPTPVCDEYLKTGIVVNGQANKSTDPGDPTYFSDTVALKIYRIVLLILKFLCLQADDGARRAEELGFLDLCQFPELPDPDILHGLQDQSIAIVTEICEANKSKPIQSDTQDVCLLLLKILEMTLYLELVVCQICGIRPVLGRVEEFTKEVRSLVRATEGQAFLKSSMNHLKQIVSVVYPALLHSEGIL